MTAAERSPIRMAHPPNLKMDEGVLTPDVEGAAKAALEVASSAGARYCAVRAQRVRSQHIRLHDGELEACVEEDETGCGVRVLLGGAWGFAAGSDLSPVSLVEMARRANGIARSVPQSGALPLELANEAPLGSVLWVSPHEIDPFSVPLSERIERLRELSSKLQSSPRVQHVLASVDAVVEQKLYVDAGGTTFRQHRVRIHPELTAIAVDETSGFETLRTLAPPTARGWEYLMGTGWDWDEELEAMPGLLGEKLAAPSVSPGVYDLVIDPTNLWLTIHESVGHATELDRALGYEAAYAGTSFATPDKLGSLRYGSDVMNVTADRTAPFGLATVGWDDEGVGAQSWDLVRAGTLVGYQLDRSSAAQAGQERSNGCSYADSALHVPIQRMANVSLQPASGEGPDLEEIASDVRDGIYIVGDGSWSIDMQRYNFQFTGQRFHRIRDGRIGPQLRDVAYQSSTTDFWGSLEAVGGSSTYQLGGSFVCGKGQPAQVAPVSHGCPAALFRSVRVLNARSEAGR